MDLLEPATFSCDDGGKTKVRVHLKPDRLVGERQKLFLYRRKHKRLEIPFCEIVSVVVFSSTTTVGSTVEKKGSFNILRRSLRLASRYTLTTNTNSPAKECTSGDTLELHYVQRDSANVNRWHCRKIILKHADVGLVMRWKRAIDVEMEKVSHSRPKKLLVFVNPYGGVGEGKAIFENKVRPLFDLAKISYEVIVTERANYAYDHLQSCDLAAPLDGIVCVGGDGIFSELLNGILQRTATENEVNVNDVHQRLIRPELRIGVIPGGSTNAVALSMHGSADVTTATLHVVLGDDRCIDAASIFSDGKLMRFSSTMASYGYFGDLMKRSENYRWLGPKRYDVSGTHTLLKGRSYRGIVGYVEEKNIDADPKCRNPCTSQCAVCSEGDDLVTDTTAVRSDCFKGKFMLVTAAMMTCSCRHTPKGVSPGAHLGDGNADLILVHKTPRANYFRYLFRTAFQLQNPFDLPFVELKRVRV